MFSKDFQQMWDNPSKEDEERHFLKTIDDDVNELKDNFIHYFLSDFIFNLALVYSIFYLMYSTSLFDSFAFADSVFNQYLMVIGLFFMGNLGYGVVVYKRYKTFKNTTNGLILKHVKRREQEELNSIPFTGVCLFMIFFTTFLVFSWSVQSMDENYYGMTISEYMMSDFQEESIFNMVAFIALISYVGLFLMVFNEANGLKRMIKHDKFVKEFFYDQMTRRRF